MIPEAIQNKYQDIKQQEPFVYDEIFRVNAYNVEPEELKDKVVIDIGANVGSFSLLAEELGAKRIIAVEPDDFNCRLFNENIVKYGSKKIEIINKAGGAESGKEIFLLEARSTVRTTTEKNTRPIQTISLEDLMKLAGIDEKLILKIDCEGDEFNIMIGVDPLILKKFEYIYAEIHEFKEHMPKELIDHLCNLNFELIGTKEFFNYCPDGTKVVNNNKVYKFKQIKQIGRPEVTCVVSTKDRYNTTLPLALLAVAFQTYRPKKLIIFDDGEHKDLRNDNIYHHIFSLLSFKGIDWEVAFGAGVGQVANHIKSLSMAKNDWIWRCFKGDEKVETINGLKNIRDIIIGELVKTHNGRFRAVKQVYKTHYPQHKNLIWIKSKYSIIKCTPDHPFLIENNGIIEWKNAKELKSNMNMLYPYEDKKDYVFFNCFGRGKKSNIKRNRNKWIAGKNFKNEYFGNIEIDRDLARFFGLYLAEGCSGHDSIRFTFNNKEYEYINFIKKICIKKFNRIPTIHTKWATTVKLNIKSFGKKFIKWFGNEATIKRIPYFVFSWNLINKLEFLKGYLDGDGWAHFGMNRFSTSSKKMAYDIQKLLVCCGLDCSNIYVKKESKSIILKRNVNSKKSYQLSISTKGYNKLLDLLNSIKEKKFIKIKIENIELKKMPSTINSPINDHYVYNLKVDEDNTYIVGPSIVHNCDDDNAPSPDVLEKLVSNITCGVGAVGGLVIDKILPKPSIASNKIEDIYLGMNEQWYVHTENQKSKEVDHLYSSFIYRKDIAEYNTNLSAIGHREETLLTFDMKRKGFKIIMDPSAITWHFCSPTGGIRDGQKEQLGMRDEGVFVSKLREWGIKSNDYAFLVMDNGIGDHYAFKSIADLYIEQNKNKKKIAFTCYPEVFKDFPELQMASIADAKMLFGDNLDKFNLYKWMWDNKHTENLVSAFQKVLGITSKKITEVINGAGNTIIISPFSFNIHHPKSYPYWDELIPLLKTTGLKVVQIGKGGEPILDNADESLFDLPFKEIENLISNCRIWLSSDTFLQHLVNSMNPIIKGVVLWGISDPNLFGYDYNKNILQSRNNLRPEQFKDWKGIVKHNGTFTPAPRVFELIKEALNG